MENNKKFKWVVQFEVDEIWVADGFDLTEDRALDMLSETLPFANIGTELNVKIIKAPDKNLILKTQGYKV